MSEMDREEIAKNTNLLIAGLIDGSQEGWVAILSVLAQISLDLNRIADTLDDRGSNDRPLAD